MDSAHAQQEGLAELRALPDEFRHLADFEGSQAAWCPGFRPVSGRVPPISPPPSKEKD